MEIWVKFVYGSIKLPKKPPLSEILAMRLTVILYDPRTASANKNSSTGVMLSNIFRAPVGVPGKAHEIIRRESLCFFVSFLTRYFLLRPPAQDTHAYMIGRIIAYRRSQGARPPPN